MFFKLESDRPISTTPQAEVTPAREMTVTESGLYKESARRITLQVRWLALREDADSSQ